MRFDRDLEPGRVTWPERRGVGGREREGGREGREVEDDGGGGGRMGGRGMKQREGTTTRVSSKSFRKLWEDGRVEGGWKAKAEDIVVRDGVYGGGESF